MQAKLGDHVKVSMTLDAMLGAATSLINLAYLEGHYSSILTILDDGTTNANTTVLE